MVSPVSPEVRQAVFKVVDYLEDHFGIDIKPISFPKMKSAVGYFLSAMNRDHVGPPDYRVIENEKQDCFVSKGLLFCRNLRILHEIFIFLKILVRVCKNYGWAGKAYLTDTCQCCIVKNERK